MHPWDRLEADVELDRAMQKLRRRHVVRLLCALGAIALTTLITFGVESVREPDGVVSAPKIRRQIAGTFFDMELAAAHLPETGMLCTAIAEDPSVTVLARVSGRTVELRASNPTTVRWYCCTP